MAPVYCGVCSMPAEYCEFSGQLSKCVAWWRVHHPEVVGVDIVDEAASAATVEQATSALAGASVAEGDAPKKISKKDAKKKAPRVVQISRLNRGGRKFVTVITGLEDFEVDLKKASKTLSNKFACGCSVAKNATGINELVLQGDACDEVSEFLVETFEISEDDIEMLEDKKGKR